MKTPRVLIAEPSAPLANALRKFLEGTAEVQVVTYVDEAVQLVRARPPDVLVAAVSPTFDGEVLVAPVKKHAPETAVVLCYSGDEPPEQALARSRAAGADAFLSGPPKKGSVLPVVHAVLRLQGLATQVRALQAAVRQLKGGSAQPEGKGRPGLNATDEAFFKKYMLLEVKRSKRYQYPVSVLLVAFDELEARLGPKDGEARRAAVRAEALAQLSSLLRDIDVALPFAAEKFLLFLPHTPPKGSGVVARRVVERLSTLASLPGGTVSVGVACFNPQGKPKDGKDAVSFGGLVREANEALQRAQAAGGNRAEAPALEAAPKKSRISLG